MNATATFQLTTSQGGRQFSCPLGRCGELSTHDLTRRSTPLLRRVRSFLPPFNSRPHKEVDIAVGISDVDELVFQLTTSQGGRPRLSAEHGVVLNLSTHDLTRRSTHQSFGLLCSDLFQLTTSQGGRPDKIGIKRNSYAFQLTTSQGGRRST